MSRLACLLPLALIPALAACQSARVGASAEDETARDTITLDDAAMGKAPAASADADTAQCNAAPVQALVGQPLSDGLINRMLKSSGAAFPRVLGVNAAATLDLNPARLNIIIDENNIIQALHCG